MKKMYLAVVGMMCSAVVVSFNADQVDTERTLQDYNFTIPGNRENAISANYYRGDRDALWQASLDESTEGIDTVMNYWIENTINGNISSGHAIHQGSGVHSFDDLSYKGDVHLASENNNNTENIYYTSGEWDEE